MRLGLIARADNTGLGYQTRDYYRHLQPHKTILIDISNLNGNPQNDDWYDNVSMRVQGLPYIHHIEAMLDGIDVLLTAETPYNPALYDIARKRGVKTVCVENPEFYDPFRYANYPMPDAIVLPSVWLMDEIRAHAEPLGTKVYQIHHPVDREVFQYRNRTTKKTMHIAGKPAANDRNGTNDYIRAFPDGIVTTQSIDLARKLRNKSRMCNVFTDIANHVELYSKADIMVLPRRYGGNCLPLNEALSSGMPVIMPDISPNNHLLPKQWLVKSTVIGSFEPRGKVDIYGCDIQDLIEKTTYVQEHIQEQSKIADEIAQSISWQTLKPRYIEVLEEIANS